MKRDKLPYYKSTDYGTDRIYIFSRMAESAGQMLRYGAVKIATYINDKEGRASAKAHLENLNAIK